MNKDSQQKEYFDSSKIAVIPYDTNYYWIFKSGKKAELSKRELLKIDTILKRIINKQNAIRKKFNAMDEKPTPTIQPIPKGTFFIDLKKYKRQYIAIINDKDEKIVWVNCFYHTHNPNWRELPLMISDGGKTNFSLKINLTTGKEY